LQALSETQRQNVFFHAAVLGLQFEDKTVLALYKTPAGRNRIADMREGVNMLQLDFVTDPAFFVTSLSGNTGITEMQMVSGNISHSTAVDSYGVETYGFAEQYFVGDVCNYTGVEGANQRANASIVLAVFVPDPLLGQTLNHDYATLLDAGGSIPLLFPGVYTITEMQMVPGNNLFSTSVDSYEVDTYGSAEQYFVGDVCNYTGVEGANQRANASIVLAVFVPDPLLGQTPNHDYATLLDAGGSVPLLFPGVYTIAETSMVLRTGGETLPSTKKTCINVLKRTPTDAQKTDPGIIQRVPLEYATLVDTLPKNYYRTENNRLRGCF